MKKLIKLNPKTNLYFIFLQDFLNSRLSDEKIKKLQEKLQTLIQEKNILKGEIKKGKQ